MVTNTGRSYLCLGHQYNGLKSESLHAAGPCRPDPAFFHSFLWLIMMCLQSRFLADTFSYITLYEDFLQDPVFCGPSVVIVSLGRPDDEL